MKVLHVYREFMPQQSGVARHIDGLARALRAHGVESAVFAPVASPAAVQATAAGGPPWVGGSLARLAAAAAAVDVVHLHGARTPMALWGALAARRARRPTVYTPHCYYDHGGPALRVAKRLWDQTAERFLTAGASAVILLDDWWTADLARRGLKPARVVVVPNCVLAADVRARAAASPPIRLEGEPALATVGRLDPVKRIDDAIQALAFPGMERAALHVAGTGGDRARLERAAAEAGVADRVRFYGWLPDADAARLIAGADVFALPSEREGLPTAMLEALLLGTPAVASAIDGNRAIAAAVGWSGLFPMGDPAALAATALAWGGRRVPEEIVTAVEEKFSWERRSAEIAALYRAAAGRSP